MQSKVHLVILGAGKPFSGEQHSALRFANGTARVLDWSLQASEFLNPECHFISGYQAEAVKASYPEFTYHYNPEWKSTKAGWSLLHGLSAVTDCLITYSDILFRENTLRQLMETNGDLVVAVDSHWRTRYAGRQQTDLERCEKVCLAGQDVTTLGHGVQTTFADAEFIGLVRLSTNAIVALQELKRCSESMHDFIRQARLSDLIELLRIRGLQVAAVDVLGDWAELNEPQDLARFVLGTKAQTLGRLKNMVRLSRIEAQVSFTVAEWREQQSHWVNEIQRQFEKQPVVVRSSALSEDGFHNSNAGAYTSLLNVNGACLDTVRNAVETVIASYPDGNPANEVLVQPMLRGVLASGVVFTRSLANGAPYYVANYDDISGSTESITNGSSREHKTLVIRRDADESSKAIPDNLRSLLPALREIESLLGYDSLDVEFALTEDYGLHVLQVRPIAVDHSGWGEIDADFYAFIAQAENQFNRMQVPSPFVVGERTLFGVMPDWNPAEIIGTKPGLLAVSLYRELIMDDTWAKQRAEYGYRDVRPQPLLHSFAGHPYVDVRASFNSFIPADIKDELAYRLVDFYIDWLEKRPHLHDKVEFDVIPTCFSLGFERWESRLQDHGDFSANEVDVLRNGLLAITSAAISRNAGDLDNISRLESRYLSLKNAKITPLDKAFSLLDDARRYGTLPFAHLARSAFVAVTLLRSAVNVGVLTDAEVDDFLNTIRTVSHMLTHDAQACADDAMSWEDFVDKYGHLRPGTYDINSPSYRQDPERFLRPIVVATANNQSDNIEAHEGALWNDARGRFVQALNQAGLDVDEYSLDAFLRQAIEGREYAKFAFTRNLSLAMDELLVWAEDIGVERKELAQITISDLRSLQTGSTTTSDAARWIRSRAKMAMNNHELISSVELPPLLCSTEDFSVFLYPSSQANYVGSGCITAPCLDLEQHDSNVDVSGMIVMIPQADPGFDWLFGRQIAGLITMYGGANSHMAIRAAEFGLPAAIGVGETHYRSLATAHELELNPANRVIRVIR